MLETRFVNTGNVFLLPSNFTSYQKLSSTILLFKLKNQSFYLPVLQPCSSVCCIMLICLCTLLSCLFLPSPPLTPVSLPAFKTLDELQVNRDTHKDLRISSIHSTINYLQIHFAVVIVAFINWIISYCHVYEYTYVQIVSDVTLH